MCDPATAVMVGMSTMQAYSAIQEGQQAEAMGEYKQDQAAADASAEIGAAKVNADLIRKQAKRQRSAAQAQLAANGVQLGAGGTAEEIDSSIVNDSELDAQMGMFGAKDAATRLNVQGAADAAEGKAAKNASYINAATSLGKAAGSVYQSDWEMMDDAPVSVGSRARF